MIRCTFTGHELRHTRHGLHFCRHCGASAYGHRAAHRASQPSAVAIVVAALAMGLVATLVAYAWGGMVFGVLWPLVHGS